MKLRLLSLILLIGLIVCVPFMAQAASDFYAIGRDYDVDNRIALEGRICTVKVEATKDALAGIEQDIEIITKDGHILIVEILSWYYDGHPKVGVAVTKDGEFIAVRRIRSQIGEVYEYKLLISQGNVHLWIEDTEGYLTLYYVLKDQNASYIKAVCPYIEYWRDQDAEGSFYFYGFVTIDDTRYIKHKEDSYHKMKGIPFGMYMIHHNWGTSYYDKGEIDDR